jgi:hypothetical protein
MTGTPSWVVGGKLLSGARDYAGWRRPWPRHARRNNRARVAASGGRPYVTDPFRSGVPHAIHSVGFAGQQDLWLGP